MSETPPEPYRPDPFKPVPLPPQLAAAREMARRRREFEARYHTFWRRLGAIVVDWFALFPLSEAVALVAGLVANHGAGDASHAINVTGSLAPVTYSIWMHGRFGQTLGKMACGVKVLRARDETRISYGRALLRDSPTIVSLGLALLFTAAIAATGPAPEPGESPGGTRVALLIVWWLVTIGWSLAELVTMFSNSRRRSVHDYLAGTVVVKTAYLDQAAAAPAQALLVDHP